MRCGRVGALSICAAMIRDFPAIVTQMAEVDIFKPGSRGPFQQVSSANENRVVRLNRFNELLEVAFAKIWGFGGVGG